MGILLRLFFFLFLTNRLWSVTVQCFLPSTVWEVSASVKLCFSLPTCLSPNFGTAVGPVNFYGRSKKRFRIFKLVQLVAYQGGRLTSKLLSCWSGNWKSNLPLSTPNYIYKVPLPCEVPFTGSKDQDMGIFGGPFLSLPQNVWVVFSFSTALVNCAVTKTENEIHFFILILPYNLTQINLLM